MYCQLYDLPTGGKEQSSEGGTTPLIAFLCYFTGEWERRQLSRVKARLFETDAL
jgi:hypothetical protein